MGASQDKPSVDPNYRRLSDGSPFAHSSANMGPNNRYSVSPCYIIVHLLNRFVEVECHYGRGEEALSP